MFSMRTVRLGSERLLAQAKSNLREAVAAKAAAEQKNADKAAVARMRAAERLREVAAILEAGGEITSAMVTLRADEQPRYREYWCKFGSWRGIVEMAITVGDTDVDDRKIARAEQNLKMHENISLVLGATDADQISLTAWKSLGFTPPVLSDLVQAGARAEKEL